MKKEYSYHGESARSTGIIMTTAGAAPFCIIFYHLIVDKHIDITMLLVLKVAVLFAWAGTFLWAGIWLLVAYRGNKVYTLEITDKGISYGSRTCDWDRIKSFAWRRRAGGGEPTFVYRKKGSIFFQSIPLTDTVSEEERNHLFRTLKIEVAPTNEQLKLN